MQTSQFKICTTCDTLTSLYSQVDCSVMQFMKNKWTNQSYNTSLHFDNQHVKDLLRLKRIIGERLFNPEYPSNRIKTDDVISYAVKSLYKARECHPCPCVDFTDFITTTSTTTNTSSSSTTSL